MTADATTPESPRPYLVASSPHIRSGESIPRIMWTVNATLAPALLWAVHVFGVRALTVTALSVVSAVLTEAVCQLVRRKPVTVLDGSAVLTGVLLAFVVPVHVPWYVPVVGSVFAIGIVKQAFGGLGCNIWNPALAGRAFVLAAWTGLMTVGGGWPVAYHHKQAEGLDAVTAATPLTRAKKALKLFNSGERGDLPAPETDAMAAQGLGEVQKRNGTPLMDLFLGRVGGCIGEVSALMLLLGAIPLLVLGYVKWQVPVLFIGTVGLLVWALPVGVRGEHETFWVSGGGQPLFHLFAGGLFLGAFYMATDMVTSPITGRGLAIFAVGCGVLTVVIRYYGGYPEGVCYAILLMNTATPVIDRYTRSKVFGQKAKS